MQLRFFSRTWAILSEVRPPSILLRRSFRSTSLFTTAAVEISSDNGLACSTGNAQINDKLKSIFLKDWALSMKNARKELLNEGQGPQAKNQESSSDLNSTMPKQKDQIKNTNAKKPIIKGAIQDKKGTISFPNGSVYTGDIQKGKADGVGKVVFAKGGFYEGEWQNGKQHGQGILVLSSGIRHEGAFSNGEKNGKGKSTAVSGITFEGEWVNNLSEGDMKVTYVNGKSKIVKYVGGKFANKGDDAPQKKRAAPVTALGRRIGNNVDGGIDSKLSEKERGRIE